jgi:hypothetical protein
MSKDYEKGCANGEAFAYVAMARPIVRLLARAWGLSDRFEKANTDVRDLGYERPGIAALERPAALIRPRR